MEKSYSQEDLELFWVSLARGACAGRNLKSCLEGIRAELGESPLSAVVDDLMDSVMRNEPLSAAMARHPRAFRQHVVSLVDGGDRAGILDRVFVLIVEFAWRCPDCILGAGSDAPAGE